ncbi:hypothetical protein ASE23_26735 [Rhizobium sp. Root73]|nr:hypothetical protein ASE23_26735 [Rhizobium sp. Root73]
MTEHSVVLVSPTNFSCTLMRLKRHQFSALFHFGLKIARGIAEEVKIGFRIHSPSKQVAGNQATPPFFALGPCAHFWIVTSLNQQSPFGS